MMKVINTLLLCYLSGWLTLQTVSAEEPLILVGKENYPPFSFLDKDNYPTGIDVDIINEALKISGLNARIDLYPWPRAISLIQKGLADGIFGVGKNTQRLSYLDYTDTPIRFVTFSFFVNQNLKGDINSLDDLANEEVGLIRDYFISTELDNNKKISKYFTSNSRQLLTQVSLNRRKVAIYSTTAGIYELKNYGIENLNVIPYKNTPEYPSYLAFLKKSVKAEGAAAKISAALLHLKESGFMEKVYAKYR